MRLLETYTGPEWPVLEAAVIASHLGEGPGNRPRYETVAEIPAPPVVAPIRGGRRAVGHTGGAMLLLILDLLGIAVFAISGGLVAVRQRLDIVGVLVLATVTGLGGGWIRDVLIGDTPPASLEDWRYLLVPVSAGLLAFWFHPALARMDRLVNVFDAFGLGLFCVAGALKAAEHGARPGPGRAARHGHLHRRRPDPRRPRRTGAGRAQERRALCDPRRRRVGDRRDRVRARTPRPSASPYPAAALTIGWRLLAIQRGWRAPVAGSCLTVSPAGCG